MITNYYDYIYIYINIYIYMNYLEIQILIKNYIEYTHTHIIYIYILCIYIYIYGAMHSLIALNIEKLCFLGKLTLEVFDSKKCNDVSVNIKFP